MSYQGGFKIFVLIMLIFWVSYGVFFDDCTPPKDQAANMVINDLERRNLDISYLSKPTKEVEICAYSFTYNGQGQKLGYVIVNTWLHGVKLNVWDYKGEREDRSNKASQPTPEIGAAEL